MKIEDEYKNTLVYTINILEDNIRSISDEYNLNFDVTTSRFISFLKGKILVFYELDIDHFRMLAQYCKERFSKAQYLIL